MALWFYKVSFLKKNLNNANLIIKIPKKFLTHYVFGMKKTAAAALPEGKYHWTTFPHMHSGNSGWHLFSLVGFNWFYVVMFGTSPNLRTNNLGNYKFPLSANSSKNLETFNSHERKPYEIKQCKITKLKQLASKNIKNGKSKHFEFLTNCSLCFV